MRDTAVPLFSTVTENLGTTWSRHLRWHGCAEQITRRRSAVAELGMRLAAAGVAVLAGHAYRGRFVTSLPVSPAAAQVAGAAGCTRAADLSSSGIGPDLRQQALFGLKSC